MCIRISTYMYMDMCKSVYIDMRMDMCMDIAYRRTPKLVHGHN